PNMKRSRQRSRSCARKAPSGERMTQGLEILSAGRLRKLREKLLGGEHGGLWRGTLTLLAGSGAGRIIAVLSMPVLTRLYGPEDFGVLALFTALTGMLVPVATLRYVLALPLPRKDGVAINLLALNLGLLSGFSLTVAVFLGIF